MLSFLPGPILGGLSYLLYFINTAVWGTLLIPTAILKLLIPVPVFRNLCNRILNGTANKFILSSNGILRLTKKINWEVHGTDELSMDKWYLVLSNHQTWADILVLIKVFYKRIPFPKFFMKKELIWVPFIGLGCWALDYPIVKRYSKEFLKENPHLKGKDIEITRRACEKFRTIPVSIMNFVEGTRFSTEKHLKQRSPFKNLLKPRAGGIAFVLATMGDKLHSILNVTISYPQGVQSFWSFLSSKATDIRVWVETLPITKELLGDYTDDDNYRMRFQEWLNNLWTEKDKLLENSLR
jgi:1-acyl-sn-glycerol-3-phosphate acyltransferase